MRLVTRFVWTPLVLFIVNAYGDPITGSITCWDSTSSFAGSQLLTQTGTTSCGVDQTVPGTSIQSSAGGSFSADAFSVSLFASAQAAEIVSGSIFTTYQGSVNGSFSDDFSVLSDGPVRSGYLVATFNAFGSMSPDDVGADIFANIGPYSFQYGKLGCGLYIDACSVDMVPITLGVPLEVSLGGYITSATDDDSFSADLSGTLTFSFFEEDGTTSVGWTDPPFAASTPEPNAAWLAGLGLALLAFYRGSRHGGDKPPGISAR